MTDQESSALSPDVEELLETNVDELADALAEVDDIEVIEEASNEDPRSTAWPLYADRIAELEGGPGEDSGAAVEEDPALQERRERQEAVKSLVLCSAVTTPISEIVALREKAGLPLEPDEEEQEQEVTGA